MCGRLAAGTCANSDLLRDTGSRVFAFAYVSGEFGGVAGEKQTGCPGVGMRSSHRGAPVGRKHAKMTDDWPKSWLEAGREQKHIRARSAAIGQLDLVRRRSRHGWVDADGARPDHLHETAVKDRRLALYPGRLMQAGRAE